MYFDFYGVFDPAEITKRLDLKPTRQFKSGEPIPPSGRHRRDGWLIESGPVATFEIADLLKQLQAAVTASPEQIKKVSSELSVEPAVTCEVLSVDSMPSICFSEEFVRWTASIGAAIDVDIMLLEKEEE